MAPSRSNNKQDKQEGRPHKKMHHHLDVSRCASLFDLVKNGTATTRNIYSASSVPPPLWSPSSLLHHEGKNSTRKNLLLNHASQQFVVARQHHHDGGPHDTALNGDSMTVVWPKNRLDHHGMRTSTTMRRCSTNDRVLTANQIIDIIDMALELTKDEASWGDHNARGRRTP